MGVKVKVQEKEEIPCRLETQPAGTPPPFRPSPWIVRARRAGLHGTASADAPSLALDAGVRRPRRRGFLGLTSRVCR
jgi:hypothetical protein